jgi:DNA polymerase III delta subunit
VKSIVLIGGPSDGGPGERGLMLGRAAAVFEELGVDEVTRVDVPGKGSGEEASDAGVRAPVQVAIPALQSGSLFGGPSGLLVVDAQGLLKAEATILAEVLGTADHSAIAAVFVASGAVPAPLGRLLGQIGERLDVKRLTERTAADWLSATVRERGIRIDGGGAEALIQRFGTDVASIGKALDQLVASGAPITADEVYARFKNRPDEPTWMYMDAVAAGDRAEALRRLEDFLLHGHPLVLLATIQTDLRRRALSTAASTYDELVEMDGGRRGFPLEKVWKQRHRVKDSDLRLALGALARADLVLKTAPEPTHRVTMERLTVALCRWYGGKR